MLDAPDMTLNPGTAIEYARHAEHTRAALGATQYEHLNHVGRELEGDAAVASALQD